MKLGTSRSPKLAGLARDLGINRREAAGLLCFLWEWTWEQAPRGDIGRWSDEDIAEAVHEPPDRAALLVDALIRWRWLDTDSEHRLVVHDYAEHLPEFMKKRLSRKGVEPLENGNGAGRRTDGGRTADRGVECSGVESRGEEAPRASARAPSRSGRRKRDELDPDREALVTWAVEHYAEKTGIRVSPDSAGNRKPLRDLLRRGDDCTGDPDAFREAWRDVVADRFERKAEWSPERMREFWPLVTICRPSHWSPYLAEARTPKPAQRATSGQRGGNGATSPALVIETDLEV